MLEKKKALHYGGKIISKMRFQNDIVIASPNHTATSVEDGKIWTVRVTLFKSICSAESYVRLFSFNTFSCFINSFLKKLYIDVTFMRMTFPPYFRCVGITFAHSLRLSVFRMAIDRQKSSIEFFFFFSFGEEDLRIIRETSKFFLLERSC